MNTRCCVLKESENIKAETNFNDSVLFLTRPRSDGWSHHGRTFSIYLCPMSF